MITKHQRENCEKNLSLNPTWVFLHLTYEVKLTKKRELIIFFIKTQPVQNDQLETFKNLIKSGYNLIVEKSSMKMGQLERERGLGWLFLKVEKLLKIHLA